ncbi:MAG: hypothetical protein ACRC7O_04415, partial [Fimbriiglobus sp.]
AAAFLWAATTITGAYFQTTNYDDILERGVTVPGEITEAIETGGKKGNNDLVVKYRTTGDYFVDVRFEVEGKYFYSRVRDKGITDPHVKIRYLPENPVNAIVIDGTFHMSFWKMSLIYMVVAVGMGAIVYSIVGRIIYGEPGASSV